MLELLKLFFEFFKVGLFTFGGGYASLPFLYEIAEKYTWYTKSQLTQFIAISGLTPGPMGLNMATYSGFSAFKYLGAITASIALCLPMVILTVQIFRFYNKFESNKYVKRALFFLKPASCALIASVALKLFWSLIVVRQYIFGFILVLILFILSFKFPRNPVIYIVLGSVLGIYFKYFLKFLI